MPQAARRTSRMATTGPAWIGYVSFRRGRKASSPALTWTGVALLVYPYVVPQTWLLWVVGAALCGWVYAKWN